MAVTTDRGEAARADLDCRYCIARPRVADELIDDELVVIHFETGKYHGIRGGGVEVWRQLDAGHSLSEITEQLALRYSRVDDRVVRGVIEFVSELEKQKLILRSAREAPLSFAGESGGTGRAFATPELDTRDDLQDYLELDPIHDVDERGWPNARQ